MISSGSRSRGEAGGVIWPTSPTLCLQTIRFWPLCVYLRSLYDQRSWLAPSELLDRISRDRRAMELGFAEGRPRDVWRRLRFVIDQAREWSDATGGNLRQYLRWVNLQTEEGVRVAESILPETDDDAVRIMTIHSAKGLEFPITIVSGMSTARTGPSRTGSSGVPPDGNSGLQVRQQGRDRGVLGMEAHRRADELPRAHPPVVCGVHAGPGPPGRLVAQEGASVRASGRRSARTPSSFFSAWAACSTDLPDGALAVDRLPAVVLTPPAPPLPLGVWESELSESLLRTRRVPRPWPPPRSLTRERLTARANRTPVCRSGPATSIFPRG